MKFSLKLLLWTLIVMAAAFGFSGFYFVNYVFERALDREAGQALDESSILKVLPLRRLPQCSGQI